MSVHHLTDASFDSFLQRPGTVLVDFTAEWCPPCKRIAPVVEQIAAENPNVAVAKLDVDESPGVAARMGVMSMPTFMVFLDGQKVGQVVGPVPKAMLVQALKG